MFKRPTSMAAAFINATVKAERKSQDLSQPKVDHWVARRVALNATDRGEFGMVTEYDHSPPKPMQAKRPVDDITFEDVPY